MMTLPMEGGCRCGQVRIRVTAAPLLTMACHCTGCQRMSSSAFSLGAAIPADGFSVIQGEPAIGGLHGATRHFFCPYCMTWMFTRPEGMDRFVNVRTPMMDDPSGLAPFMDTFMCEALPWVKPQSPNSYDTFPPPDAYPALIADYAKANAG